MSTVGVCVCVYVQNIADPSLVEDPAKDKQFAEPAIDAIRIQKDEVCKALLTLHFKLTNLANLCLSRHC